MSQHGRDNNNNMKRHSPEPIALGSGLFFVCDFYIYLKFFATVDRDVNGLKLQGRTYLINNRTFNK